MDIQTGDTVRFLNATGGGKVVRIIDKKLVGVEDENGFEIPVLIKECVIIEPAGAKTKPTGSGAPSLPVSKVVPPVPAVSEPEKKPEITEFPEGEKLNVALVFLPNNPKSLHNTSFDCYLVNDSNYFLYINYMYKTGNSRKSRYTGEIDPNMKIFIEELHKEDLNNLEHICVQLIAYKKNKVYDVKNPYSQDLYIELGTFYKLHRFRENDYFDEEALVFPLIRNDVPEKLFRINDEDLEIAVKEKQSAERPQRMPIKKKEPAPILEVDLHGSALLDTLSGLSNADILNYQLEKFRDTLNENRLKKGQKIVFIHGKGEGVLRKAIVDELKSKYKTYQYQDASFREYGFGATMVVVK